MVSRARHLPSRKVRVIRAIWLWTWSCGSPSRLVPCSQKVTISPAASNRPGSRPSTPGAVIAEAGDPGPGLQVLQSTAVGPVQDRLERLLASRSVRAGPLVPGQPSPALVLLDRSMQHRDGLGERHRHIGVAAGWRVACAAWPSSSMSRSAVACGSASWSRASDQRRSRSGGGSGRASRRSAGRSAGIPRPTACARPPGRGPNRGLAHPDPITSAAPSIGPLTSDNAGPRSRAPEAAS